MASGAKRSRSTCPPQQSQEVEEGPQIIICGGCSLDLCRSNTYASLRCGHYMCLECFGSAQANRSANLKIKCPYYRASNDNCSCETDTWHIHKAGGNVVSQTILQPKEHDAMAAVGDEFVVSFGHLEVGVLANIYAFLSLENITCLRGINKKSMEAVKMTTPPPTDFSVGSMNEYNAMRVMARAMPNLQQIALGRLGYGHRYNGGEDPDETEDRTSFWDRTSHDIGMISNFSKLKILSIIGGGLNGRYPFLFNFPLLQKLNFNGCSHLKWDLEMLGGLPLLKELYCWGKNRLTGNIISLRVLKDTLEKVEITSCSRVVGNFIDLADFPHLKKLDLRNTAVRGDIRDIGENDFSSLEELDLPRGVYGAMGYEFQRISDGPEFIRAVYLLKKQRPALINIILWYGELSGDSPDRYESVDEDEDNKVLPFHICFVEAGSRVGYRWENVDSTNPCEVNWLDPEPDRDSSEYEIYVEELRKMRQVNFYRGFHQPPTEEEYRRLCEGRGIR